MNKGGKHFRTETIVTYLFMFVLLGGGVGLIYFLDLGFTGFVVSEGPGVIIERGSNWNKFDNQDGTFRIEISELINYNNGSEFVPIEIELLNSSYLDYEYEMVKAPYKVYFQDNLNSGKGIRFEKDGYFFTYDLSGGKMRWAVENKTGTPDEGKTKSIGSILSSPITIETNNQIRYNDSFLNTDIQFILSNNMLKENFILKSLPTGVGDFIHLEYFGEIQHSGNLTLFANGINQTDKNFNTTGGIEFRDSNNKVIFNLPKPFATDSNGSRTGIKYNIKISAGKIQFHLRIPSSWLSNSSRVYPVIIDPTISLSSEASSVASRNGNSDTNFGNDNFIAVGKDSATLGEIRSFLSFNISLIPSDAIISSSIMNLWLFEDNAESFSRIIDAHRVTNEWFEDEITWNERKTGVAWDTEGGDFDSSITASVTIPATPSDGFQTLNLTTLTKQWYNNTYNNYGVVIKKQDAGTWEHKFYSDDFSNASLRPKLVINYTIDDGLPPTISINSPENISYTTSTISFTATSSESIDTWVLNYNGTNITGFTINTSITVEDGFHHLLLYANDSVGNMVLNDSIYFTVTVDSINPNLTLSEPTGTKTSRTGIQATWNVSDLNLQACWYNVHRGGNEEISNTTVTCLDNSTTFDVSVDADFTFNFYANDSAGNLNSTSSSFTVSTSPPSPPSSSGGGGGGSTTIIQTTNVTAGLTVNSISGFIIDPGESKTIIWKVKNTGTSFLNDCVFESFGDYLSWISYGETKNLAAGEEYDFIFDLNIPEDTGFGSYELGLVLNCKEISKTTRFNVEIIKKKLKFDLLGVVRENDESVKVSYSLEELSGIDQEVKLEFLFFEGNEKVAETLESKFILANSKNEFETFMNIDPSLEGNLNLLINLNSETYSAFVQENIILSSPISGFATFGDLIEGNSIISYVIIVLFFIFAVIMIGRIFKFRGHIKKAGKNRKKVRKKK